VPVARRQVPLRATGAGAEQDPVDRPPVISPPATPLPRITRQHGCQPGPLLIGKIMPFNHGILIYTQPTPRSRKHALVARFSPAPTWHNQPLELLTQRSFAAGGSFLTDSPGTALRVV
jgi:hypothetical protein